MNKKGLANKAAEILKANNVRKHVPVQKSVLHVSDDYGNKKDFVIRKESTDLLYSPADVSAILEAVLIAIEDSIKHGEDVYLHGFGNLGVTYRPPRTARHPETQELVDVPGRYVPKFDYGNTLRMAARVYELSLNDKEGVSSNGV